MSNPEETPNWRPESPRIKKSFGDMEIEMTWSNTWLRHFDEGDGIYNHVSHALPSGEYLAFQVDEADRQELIENRYPSIHEPLVDQSTMDWYIELAAKELDSL